MNELFAQINVFLHRTERNTWIEDDIMRLYIRKSKRSIYGKLFDFFDIAAVEIIEEKNRGKGYFTDFLNNFLETYPEKNIFVEAIVNPRFLQYFKKLGFKEKDNYGETSNLYLLKNQYENKGVS